MNDPEKLSLTTRTELGRILLQSAESDHSAPGAAQRALLAVSVGVGAAVVSGTSSALSAGGTASGVASASGKWAGLLMLKWLGVGLLAGVSTLVSLDYATQRKAPALMRSAPERAPQAALGGAATPKLAPSREDAPPPSSEPSPALAAARAPSAPTPHARASAEPSATPSESSALALAELQAVRAALAGRAPERALTLLAAFEQRPNAAAFAEEATVLRIQALADARRGADARALAADFLSRYPNSAYAERVRSKVQQP